MEIFREGISLNRLPTPEPIIFNGDPLQFHEWKNTFSALISSKAISSTDKLYYLRKYTPGNAAKLIEGSFLRSDDTAFDDAWRKLTSRYGQQFTIHRAYRNKINEWPKIKDKDIKTLQEFSDFLNSCNDAIPHIEGLSILNDCEENRKIVEKLPDWLIRRWNRQVTYSLKNNKYPSFSSFCEFLTEEVVIACNPITSPYMIHTQEKEKRERSSVRVLNTQAVNRSSEQQQSPRRYSSLQNSNTVWKSCTFCKQGDHSIHKCAHFESKSEDEKRQFIVQNQLCFGCLRKGHTSKDCRNRAVCAKCKHAHPTPLHREILLNEIKESEESTTVPKTAVSCYTTEGSNTSMIVPVWLSSSSDPSKEILTYAILDTQSDSTFITNRLVERIHANSQPARTRLKLTTMTSNASVVNCHLIQDLCIRGFKSEKSISLANAYTRDFIPAEKTLIPTPETAKQWPHLKSLTSEIPPIQDCRTVDRIQLSTSSLTSRNNFRQGRSTICCEN